MKSDSLHLSFEAITDFVTGDKTESSVEEHLRSCAVCEFEMTRTRQLIDLMRTDDSESAPSFALASILRSFDDFRRPEKVESEPTIGQRLRAILRLDSSKLEPAFGFRSVGAANSRQLLFSTENGSIDIRIMRAEANWVISGQVLGQITGGIVKLIGQSGESSTEIDGNGEFRLPVIAAGSYELRLQSEGFEVEVPDLVIG